MEQNKFAGSNKNSFQPRQSDRIVPVQDRIMITETVVEPTPAVGGNKFKTFVTSDPVKYTMYGALGAVALAGGIILAKKLFGKKKAEEEEVEVIEITEDSKE